MKKLYLLFVVMVLTCIGAVAQSTFYLRGDMNDWSPSTGWQFQQVSGDDYILENVEIAAGVGFKVADSDWRPVNYGGVSEMEVGNDYTLTYNSSGNCTLAVNFKGNVKFNLSSHVIRFEGEAETPVVDPDAWKNWYVNFKGDFNNWSSNEGVKADADGIATSKTYIAKGEFKVCVYDGNDKWHTYGKEVLLNEWMHIPDNGENMSFPADVIGNEVVFKYDVLNEKLMVVYEEPAPVAPETFFVYSTMTGFTPVEMTKTETGFKAEGVVLPEQGMDDMPYFKFSTVANPQSMSDFYGAEKAFKWIQAGEEYPITEGSSSNWEIVPGTYDITVTVAADASMTFTMEQKSAPVEMITIYWDNAAGWENVICAAQDEYFQELAEPVAMVPVFDAETVASLRSVSPANLLAAQVPANTVHVMIATEDYSHYWMNFDTSSGETTAAIADQMVYNETGCLGHVSEVLGDDPQPETKKVFISGDNTGENKTNRRTGIVGTEAEGFTIQITGNETKTLDNSNSFTINGTAYVGMKNSNGAQITVTLPEGYVGKSVTIYSTINADAGTVSYWSEVDGIEYDGSTQTHETFRGKDTTFDTNTFPLSGKNSFTFNNKGKQLIFVLAVEMEKAAAPQPELPEALYLRGGVNLENNMLTKDGIVYSGNVTIMGMGSMYGEVRVYTANSDNATSYGGVAPTGNCVAQPNEILELAEDGVNISVLPGDYNVVVEWNADIKTIKFVPIATEKITVYWNNTDKKWKAPYYQWGNNENPEMISDMGMDYMTRYAESPAGYELWSAEISAAAKLLVFNEGDESSEYDTTDFITDVVDNGVYGPAGFICTLDELSKPAAPEALYLRGSVKNLQENMLTKDGIVYSGTIAISSMPGEMYGLVRVYTENNDNATSYGAVSETENCVAQSGEILELAEDGVNISILPGTYSVKVEWADDIKSIVFTAVETESYTIYWDNTTAKWGEPWVMWSTGVTDPDAAGMTRDAAASPEGYELWSAKIAASTVQMMFNDAADDTYESYSEIIETIVDNGVYGPAGFICTLDELSKPQPPVPAETLLFKWHNAEGTDDYVAEAGTIEAKVDAARLNYANTALEVVYKTICLSGKKNDDATAHMVVTFTEPLKEGDVISMTAFRNKDATGKGASAYLAFDNGASTTIGGADGLGFVNLNAAGETPEATEPNTLTYTVTAAEAGATSMKMTRDKSSTNLFVTNLTISGKREAPQPGFEAPETLFLLGLSDPIEMTRTGNTFSVENVSVPGFFGMCPVMSFQDVADENDENARIFGPKAEETEEGVATCKSGVPFELVEIENREAMTSFTTPSIGVYNFSVTFEEGNIVATITEVEPEKIVVYWDNTDAQWEKPAAIPDFTYFWYGEGKAPIEMVAVEGKPNLYMAEIPDNLDMVIFMDLAKDPMDENYDPEVSSYTREEAPVANMVYSMTKEPVDISNWSAIVDIEAESGEAVYYDLRGVRVDKPAAGNLYIRVEDGKASKVRF